MYIGKIPATGAFQKCDALSASGTADYTLQVGSVNVSPESVNHMIVSLNGVIQAPTTAYTVAGAVLSFASSLTSSDSIDFVLLLGNVLDIGTPSDNTVAIAKIQDDAVTLAKMAAGTDGNVISYDASGNPVAIATGSDGQVLTSAGAGQPPAFEAAPAGGLTEADSWRLTTGFTGDAAPISSNLERSDTAGQGNLGTGMSESSGIFTFPSTGWWLITFQGLFSFTGTTNYISMTISTTVDDSSYVIASYVNPWINAASGTVYTTGFCSALFDVTSTSTHKVRFDIDTENNSAGTTGSTDRDTTAWKFIKLGAT
jgi:hypothetical protein